MSIFLSDAKKQGVPKQFTVTTTTKACVGRAKNRVAVSIVVAGSQTVEFSRDPTFTFGNGLPVAPSESIAWTPFLADDTINPIYCCVNSSTGDIRIEETLSPDLARGS